MEMEFDMYGNDESENARLSELAGLHREIAELRLLLNMEQKSVAILDEERFKILVNEVPEYLYSIEFFDGKITNIFHSPRCEEITGYTPAEFSENQFLWVQMIYAEDRDRVLEFIHGLEQPMYCKSIEHRILHKDGSVRWVLNMTTVHQGITTGTIRQSGFLLDITWRKHEESKNLTISIENRRHSMIDALTNLYNRRGFMELAEQQLRVAAQMNHSVLVFFIDVDGLKRINDTYGHHEGDNMLVSLSQVLKGAFRESDLIARIGGDEFTVLTMNNVEDPHREFLGRLDSIVENRNRKTDRERALSISVGISKFNFSDSDCISGLIERADKDMYERRRSKFS